MLWKDTIKSIEFFRKQAHLITANHIISKYNPLKHIPYEEQKAFKNHACAVCKSKTTGHRVTTVP